MTLNSSRPSSDVLVIGAEGTLDERNAETLVTEVHRALEEGVTRVVIDCSGLRYVSSFGLGAMVRVHKRLGERGRGLMLAAVSPRLLTELRLVRLSDVFVRVPSVDAALGESAGSER